MLQRILRIQLIFWITRRWDPVRAGVSADIDSCCTTIASTWRQDLKAIEALLGPYMAYVHIDLTLIQPPRLTYRVGKDLARKGADAIADEVYVQSRDLFFEFRRTRRSWPEREIILDI